MSILWCSLAILCGSFAAPGELDPAGYLRGTDGTVIPYVPRAGDILLYDDQKLMWHILYRLCGTEPPDHSGIVIAMPNGCFGSLEAGPDNGTRVCILDLSSRLRNFKGTIWIRRLRQELNTDESTRLTNFAYTQDGKRYAMGRLFLHATPFRARGELRKKWLGHTCLDRNAWLCSEIVIAAATAVGLLDATRFPANAIYPRDIIDDVAYDLSPFWHPAAVWACEP